LGIAKAQADEIKIAYNGNLVSYDIYRLVLSNFQQAQAAFENGNYQETFEKAKENATLAEQVLAEVEEKRKAQEAFSDFLAIEYGACPVCGKQLDNTNGSCHTCPTEYQKGLAARGRGENFNLTVTKVGEKVVIRLEAVPYRRGEEYDVYLRIEDQEIDFNQQVTLNLWQAPSKEQQEYYRQLNTAVSELAKLERELGKVGESRILVTFRLLSAPDGRQQLQARGKFTGTVQDKKAANGWSEHTDVDTLFVCKSNCPWLVEMPKDDETWVCTPAFQIGMRGKMPIIVVNPQVRVDRKAELEAEIARLQGRETDQEDGAMASAFAEALSQKRHW